MATLLIVVYIHVLSAVIERNVEHVWKSLSSSVDVDYIVKNYHVLKSFFVRQSVNVLRIADGIPVTASAVTFSALHVRNFVDALLHVGNISVSQFVIVAHAIHVLLLHL